MLTISERIKDLRIKNNMTQKNLADHLDVSQNAVYNWENGKRDPNLEIIEKIASIFDVTPSYLMGWEPSESLCEMTTFLDEIDDYTQELGKFLYYNPKHKVLFDASMEVQTEDIDFAKEFLDRINGKTPDTYSEE